MMTLTVAVRNKVDWDTVKVNVMAGCSWDFQNLPAPSVGPKLKYYGNPTITTTILCSSVC